MVIFVLLWLHAFYLKFLCNLCNHNYHSCHRTQLYTTDNSNLLLQPTGWDLMPGAWLNAESASHWHPEEGGDSGRSRGGEGNALASKSLHLISLVFIGVDSVTIIIIIIIHRVSKKRPTFDAHEWILIFFGRNVTDKVGNQKTLYYAASNNLCFCTTW